MAQFKDLESKLHISVGNVELHPAKFTNPISQHAFPHAVKLSFFGYNQDPTQFIEQNLTLPAPLSYYLVKMPLGELLDPAFITPFVPRSNAGSADSGGKGAAKPGPPAPVGEAGGILSVLSMNTRIDQHDVFALTPSGHFIFDLTKDTYELSGLTGGRLTSSPTTTTLPNPVPRFVVTVDLHTDPAFQPGTKAYTRFRWTLDNILNAPAEFALTCIDPQTGAEPAQWHNRLPAAWSPERIDMPAPTWTTTSPYQPILIPATATATAKATATAPDTDANTTTDLIRTTLGAPFFTQLNSKVARQLPEIFRDRAQEIFEWLGLYYHESPRIAETDRSRQSSISHYQVPKPHQSGVALTLSYSGFLSPYTVLALYRQLPHLIRKWNESVIDRQDPKAQPAWAALSVWGFKDAPVSYGLKQRNVLSSGENDYSLLLGPDNEGVLYQVCDILDEYS
ncbi:hypothetical protein H4R33_005174 [Dimargaris cristalligena]|nr:hypothetical protein H4R33_005174 [Dimargaris cristalligena]